MENGVEISVVKSEVKCVVISVENLCGKYAR